MKEVRFFWQSGPILGGTKISAADGKEVSNLATAFIEKNKDKPFYLNVWLHE